MRHHVPPDDRDALCYQILGRPCYLDSEKQRPGSNLQTSLGDIYGLYICIYFPCSPIPKLMLPLCTERPAYDQSPYAAAAKLFCACVHRAARCTQVQNRPRPSCHTWTKADLPSSSATAYPLQVLDSLIKIVNYIKSGVLSFSGTSVS